MVTGLRPTTRSWIISFLENVVFPGRRRAGDQDHLDLVPQRVDPVRDLGDLLVLQRLGHLDELLDAAFAGSARPAFPPIRRAGSCPSSCTPGRSRRARGSPRTAPGAGGLPAGDSAGGIPADSPRAEHGEQARRRDQGAVGEVEDPVAGVNGDRPGRCGSAAGGACRAGCASGNRRWPPGRRARANGWACPGRRSPASPPRPAAGRLGGRASIPSKW